MLNIIRTLQSSKVCFSSLQLCLGQDVNTSEVSKNCCLTQDGDCNLISREKWNGKGHLQPTVDWQCLFTYYNTCD